LQPPRLTPTSYIVLGVLDGRDEATPYDLKQLVAATVGNFWSVPHSQIYAEPARLAAGGYLAERRERGGRRRRTYSLTDRGRDTLREWRDEPTEEMPELRDLSLLKLYFGGDPRRIAAVQRETHARKLAGYRALLEADPGTEPRGPWRTLRAGIEHERVWVDYWREIESG
jgi:DNA-binding PadR family transcriptional regulator